MQNSRLFVVSCSVLLGIFPFMPKASVQWDGQLEAGLFSSDNLSVIELEQISERSDQARTFAALLNMQWQPTTNTFIDIGGSYNDRRFQSLEDYNLQLTSLYLDSSYMLNSFALGVNYQHSAARLAGNSFLSQQQFGLYSSKVLMRQLYLRAGLSVTDKVFQTFSERNADNLELQLDMFWFANNRQRIVALSYIHSIEDSADRRYSYSSDRMRLQLTEPLTFNEKEHKLRLGVRYERRSYPDYFVAPPLSRNDSNIGFDASLQLVINKHFSLQLGSEWISNSSALDDADYQEITHSFSLRLNL